MNAIAKLKWQCHRGTKELDYFLEHYLTTYYNKADDREKALFRQILALQDSELASFLLMEQPSLSLEMTDLVKKIRSLPYF